MWTVLKFDKKNLSLLKAILNAFQINKSGEIITTLIDEFKYPKYGPGMMWETAYEKLKEKGHEITVENKLIGGYGPISTIYKNSDGNFIGVSDIRVGTERAFNNS